MEFHSKMQEFVAAANEAVTADEEALDPTAELSAEALAIILRLQVGNPDVVLKRDRLLALEIAAELGPDLTDKLSQIVNIARKLA